MPEDGQIGPNHVAGINKINNFFLSFQSAFWNFRSSHTNKCIIY